MDIFNHSTVTLRAATSAKPKGVDKENRMMRGVVVAQAMQIKDYRGSDYGLQLDDAFISDLSAYASKQKNGVLCNFGHNWNNLGRRLGRMSGFSIEDSTVYADLSIFQSADSSPGMSGLGTHVLDLAMEDAGTMMFSISFGYKYLYQRDSDDKEVKCYYYNKDGNYVQPSAELGAVYFKFDTLKAVDLVDEGAATNSLFSTQDELAQAAQTLFNAPGIEDVLSRNNYPVLDQLYGGHKSTGIIDSLRSLLGLNTKESDLLTTKKQEDVENTKLQADLTAAQEALQAEKDLNTQLKTGNDKLKASLTEMTSSLEALAKRLETLEKSPLSQHNQGDESTDPKPEALKAYEQNPINARWLANRAK